MAANIVYLTDFEAAVTTFVLMVIGGLLIWGALHFLGMLHNYLMYGYWR